MFPVTQPSSAHRDKVRVNSVHPGLIRTAMTEANPAAADQAISRYADPAEMAELVLFLASDESSYCRGRVHYRWWAHCWKIKRNVKSKERDAGSALHALGMRCGVMAPA